MGARVRSLNFPRTEGSCLCVGWCDCLLDICGVFCKFQMAGVCFGCTSSESEFPRTEGSCLCFCLCDCLLDICGVFCKFHMAGVCFCCKSPESQFPRTEGSCWFSYLLMSRRSPVRPSATSASREFCRCFLVAVRGLCCLAGRIGSEIGVHVQVVCPVLGWDLVAGTVPGYVVGVSWCLVELRAFGPAGPESLVFPFQVRLGPCPGAMAMRSRGVAWLKQPVPGCFSGVWCVFGCLAGGPRR